MPTRPRSRRDERPTNPSAGEIPLYSSPEIYEVAFGWDLTRELDFYERCFREHGMPAPGRPGRPVARVLEPCCGTGRMLEALARRGYEVAGYDLSAEMVAFADARLRPVGGAAYEGAMESFHPPGVFDAALNPVNSIGYLLEDAPFAEHLERLGEAVREGGVYILQISYGGEPPELARFGPWGNRARGLSTTLTWATEREDAAAKRSYQRCVVTARRGAWKRRLEEEHLLRYWTQEDFDRLVGASPFRLAAVYWDRFEPFPLEWNRFGEHGNLYHVLQRR
jgi:SAM-dependent methyltransferase